MVLLVLLFGFVECLCHWFAATGVSLVFLFLFGWWCLVGCGWLVSWVLCSAGLPLWVLVGCLCCGFCFLFMLVVARCGCDLVFICVCWFCGWTRG